MRAYHQSEIAHTDHAFKLLTALLSGVVVGFGALLGLRSETSADPWLALLFLALVVVAVAAIVAATNAKIDKDNERYGVYAAEYAAERRILGIDRDLEDAAGYTSRWVDPERRAGGGHNWTKRIITTFGLVVAGVALAGAALVIAVA